MSIPAEMAERHRLMFAEMAELGLKSARDLVDRQLAAEDTDVAARAALAMHRVMRTVRQTMALEQRQERERQRAEREATTDGRRDDKTRLQVRKAQVQAAVERLIWDEHEFGSDDAGELEYELTERLDHEAAADDFADQPIEACVARLCAALNLPLRPQPAEEEAEERAGADDAATPVAPP